MNLFYMSDLHVEASGLSIDRSVYKAGDVVALVGDIGVRMSEIYMVVSKFPSDVTVLYVAGNHEYYGSVLQGKREELKAINKLYPNVHFLDNNTFVKDGFAFIGSTLWTNFSLHGKKRASMEYAEENISDFSVIYTKTKQGQYRKMTAEYMLSEHLRAVSFIKKEIEKQRAAGNKVVVLTHFAPSPKSIDIKYKDADSSYWVSNIEWLVEQADIWIHGHVHDSFNYKVGDCTVLCNPRGYSSIFDLTENSKYSKEKNIRLI